MTTPVKTEGLIFHWRRHSETSLIVEWWTRDSGRIHTIAKGALRPGSKSRPDLDVFQRGELTYLPARRSRLHTLVDFLPRQRYTGIQKNYGRLLAAAYAYDLSRHYTEDDAPADDVYDLLRRFMDFLDAHPPGQTHIRHLENRFFSLLGLGGLEHLPPRTSSHPHPHRLPSYQNLIRHLS